MEIKSEDVAEWIYEQDTNKPLTIVNVVNTSQNKQYLNLMLYLKDENGKSLKLSCIKENLAFMIYHFQGNTNGWIGKQIFVKIVVEDGINKRKIYV